MRIFLRFLNRRFEIIAWELAGILKSISNDFELLKRAQEEVIKNGESGKNIAASFF